MARLPDSFLDELRARTPMAALVGRRVKLSRSGRNWKGCCPFHAEKSPSFYVYDDGYHCFGCGAHGDAIRFVMDGGAGGFMEAVEQLAGEAGLDIPKPSQEAAEVERQRLDLHGLLDQAAALYQQNLFAPAGSGALSYLRGRGLTDDTIRRFGLGFSGDGNGLARRLGAEATPALLLQAGLLREAEDGRPGRELFYNRVMFPIRDRRGRVISFGGRTLGDGQPKYVNGPETALFSKRRTLYALDVAREGLRDGAELVVVEGYMDVIALHQAGFAGAVAPLGTALTEEQVEALWALRDAPVLCFDGDAAGGRAAYRAIATALPHLTPARTIAIATLPAGDDPDTYVRQRGKEAFAQVIKAARSHPLSAALFGLVREYASQGVAADAKHSNASPREHRNAKFKEQLEEAASRIGHKGLAAEYRGALLRQFYDGRRKEPGERSYGGGPRHATARSLARPLPAEATADAERIRYLTAILLRNPTLLPRLESAFCGLKLPAPAQRLLEAMEAFADDGQSLDFANLIAHLTHLALADDVTWALAELPLPLPACAKPGATAGEAEAGWWRIYGFMRPGSLEAELAAARHACAASFTAESVQRVAALATALLGRAGDGAEAGFES